MTSKPNKKLSDIPAKPRANGPGRPKGAINKITADVRVLAQQHGKAAIDCLAEIFKDREQPAAARVAASREILDRAYGKSPQPIEGGTSNLAETLQRLIEAQPC